MILITGVTGLVGRFIADRLLSEGIPFKALIRNESIIPDILENHKNKGLIHWITGDIKDPLSLMSAFENVDTVIHNAGYISFYSGDYDEMWETNVQGTKNIVDIAISNRVKQFIHMSSVAALGRTAVNSMIDENTHWAKSKSNSFYSETKYMAELEVWKAFIEGLNVIILNPSTVLGPSDWNKGSTLIFKYVWKERRYYPTGSLNYVDVRDVATVVQMLLHSEVNGERFILSGGNIKFKLLFQCIAKQFGKNPPSIRLKDWMLSVASTLARMGSMLTGKKPLITPETIRLSKLDFNYKNDKIKSYLNFEFKPLEDTIAWTCRELLRGAS